MSFEYSQNLLLSSQEAETKPYNSAGVLFEEMNEEIFYGWWIVLATSLIHFWAAGTFFYSFTAFFNPIVDELAVLCGHILCGLLEKHRRGHCFSSRWFCSRQVWSQEVATPRKSADRTGFVIFSQINSLGLSTSFLSSSPSLPASLFPSPDGRL